jgi:hypothetical protein
VPAHAEPLIEAARAQGFAEDAAEAALATFQARLAAQGLTAARLYCFRTGGGGSGGDTPTPPARLRLLLAFSSADAALSFAQRKGLGRSPRLITLSPAQALAALLQRPAIGALLVADDAAAEHSDLPLGVRLERAELLALLGKE